MADFIEHRYDYSGGRSDVPTLTLMVGISGSGKSTLARKLVFKAQGNLIRLNRDDMRRSMYADVTYPNHKDVFIRTAEQDMARLALKKGKDVIIDDTNCIRRTRQAFEEIARQCRAKFRIIEMTTPLEECIARDSRREGKEQVGETIIRSQLKTLDTVKPEELQGDLTRPAFERESLAKGGFLPRLPDAQWVLVDIDGTVANHNGVRNAYDESRVLLDNVYEVVANWIRAIHPHYNVCLVSGRKERCGDDTCEWFEGNNIPFDHILMRHTKDNRPDTVVKQEILDELIAVIGKAAVAFVIDDRPGVVRMWKQNGLTVYPVRGGILHTPGCGYTAQNNYVTCPDCGALEDF